jgi:hypothetical protein
MDRTIKMCLGLLWFLGVAAGCSQSPSGGAATPVDPSKDPVARVAYEFLDAVLKGDTQRAGAQLTPTAMQRIIESGKQFAPPGLENASFRIGEVRKPSDSQALVQCLLTAPAADSGQTRQEEMCCLMRLVENNWRVSGIAYASGPKQPLTIMDFETGRVVQQPTNNAPTTQGTSPLAGRPSPPRTAQETVPASIR